MPIIVVITAANTHAVHSHVKACGLGYIGKCTIPVVAVEPQCASLSFVARPVHSINKENVLPAVAVVVEKRAARAESFRQQLSSKCAAVVTEMNARGRRYIEKTETGRKLGNRISEYFVR